MFWYTTGGVFRMSYLIAVGSSDGKQVDLHFGSAAEFFIYEIEGEDIRLKEKRQIEKQEEDSSAHSDTTGNCASAGCGKGGCNWKEKWLWRTGRHCEVSGASGRLSGCSLQQSGI